MEHRQQPTGSDLPELQPKDSREKPDRPAMSQTVPEEGAITVTDVISGYMAYLHDGEGESQAYWGRTEQESRKKAEADR